MVWCNPMRSLHGALPGPYVSVRVTRDALVAHRYTYVTPRCRTTQYHRTFIPLSVSLWNDLSNPAFDGVGLRVSRAGPMPFYWHSARSLFVYCCSMGWNCGTGVFELIGC